MKRTSQTGTNTIIKNIMLGLLAGILVSILMILLAAFLVHNGTMTENKINLIVTPIQFVAVLIGSLLAGKRAGKKYAIICGATALLYCMILLCTTIMFFDSTFHAVGLGIGMCAAGYIAACTICMTGKGKKRKRKT